MLEKGFTPSIIPIFRHSNIPRKMVYKGGGRLYIAALNDRYRENEES